MRAIDAAMAVLAELADNNDQLPSAWLELVPGYQEDGMNLRLHDIALIAQVLTRSAPCKFLEIGSGSSTGRLFSINKNGLNISIEDNVEWVEKVASDLPPGQGIVLHYRNEPIQAKSTLPIRHDWKAQIKKVVGYKEDELRINDMRLLQHRLMLPEWLWSITFDVVLVDGPIGSGWENPGRSGTTLFASRLTSPTSVIFVDDAPTRPHEMDKVQQFLAERYLHLSPSKRLVIAI